MTERERTIGHWLILRTDHAKEAYVARQIQHRGFDAWVPAQMVASRPHAARRVTAKAAAVVIKELPLLPRRVLAAVPVALHGDLDGIRHLVGIERDGALVALCVPAAQVAAFRAEIDRENTAALALLTRPSRRQKARWRDMKDALLDMIEQAKQVMEVAA